MKTFTLKITACNKVYYQGSCQMAVVPTADGEMGIMANHEHMTATIEEGVMRFQHEDGTWERVYVKDGMVEVGHTRVTLVVFFAEKPENVDLLKAQAEYDQANEDMMHKQSRQEYEMSKAQMARALARLKRSHRDTKLGL